MCDFKKFWLLLALFGLFVLLVLCTLVHTNSIYDEQKLQKNTKTTQTTLNQEATKPSKYPKTHKTTNSFIKKDQHGITISGLFSSQENVDTILNKFKLYFTPIFKGEIEIRQGVDDSQFLDMVENLAYYFSSDMEKGELKYSKDGLFIQGETLNSGRKESIQKVLDSYKNIGLDVKSSLNIVTPTTPKQKTKQALYELLYAQNIEFENGKSTLKPNTFALLDKIAATLQENKSLHVTIEGHTDNSGNKTLNETLSLERAHEVKGYLIKKGVKKSRLSTKGFGQTRPILPNTTDENRQKNRRVEFNIKGDR